MTVNFSTETSKIGYVPTVTVANAATQPAPKKEVIKADTLEITEKEPKKENKSMVSKFSSGVGGIKKFFASTGEYTKGFFKGLAGAAVAGSLVYTGSAVLRSIKKKPKSKATVAFSALAAVGAFAYNMYKAYLNTNDKTAQIDHRYR